MNEASNRSDIVEACERQFAACTSMGAPFTARLCRLIGARLDETSAFGRRVFAWPRDTLWPDLVPLRCCAALNILVRTGKAPALARFYPAGDGASDGELWDAIAATIAVHDAEMTKFLDSPPQTNEVVRSGVLLGGFLRIAQATHMPLALYETGASAGLNLMFDSYRYDLGEGRVWGDPRSRVAIASAWKGKAPLLEARIDIASRAAVDLKPVDARARDDRERMLAYIWPEQVERVQRIEAALDLVASSNLQVAADDALAWLERTLSQPADEGTCRVVYHSVFAQYLPQQVRADLRAAIKRHGETATARAPFAWLAMEAGPDRMSCELSLTIWPGGERRTLAKVDWHGKWAEWA